MKETGEKFLPRCTSGFNYCMIIIDSLPINQILVKVAIAVTVTIMAGAIFLKLSSSKWGRAVSDTSTPIPTKVISSYEPHPILKDPKRIVMLGDSITQQGGKPGGYVNVGVNDVWQGFQDLKNGKSHPRGNLPAGVTLPVYREKLIDMVLAAQKAGIRVVLLSPTPIYEHPDNPENRRLTQYIQTMEEVASGELIVES